MKSPWTDNERAFDPMYTEHVVVSGKRLNGASFKTTILVNVFNDDSGDPLTNEMVDTNREDILISCRKSDWDFIRKIQIGDIVTRPEYSNKVYSVSSIEQTMILDIVIHARSVKS